MKVIVDQDACVGCEMCVEVCNQIFEMDNGKAKVKVETIPKDLQELVGEAVDTCPVDAISFG